MQERLVGKAKVVGYGHVGDGIHPPFHSEYFNNISSGNLHLNVSAPKYDPELYALIEPFVYEYVCMSPSLFHPLTSLNTHHTTAAQRGSISAEHGLGLMKASHLHFSKSDVAIEVMRKLKTVFDPKGIMNPYKVLPNTNVQQ